MQQVTALCDLCRSDKVLAYIKVQILPVNLGRAWYTLKISKKIIFLQLYTYIICPIQIRNQFCIAERSRQAFAKVCAFAKVVV